MGLAILRAFSGTNKCGNMASKEKGIQSNNENDLPEMFERTSKMLSGMLISRNYDGFANLVRESSLMMRAYIYHMDETSEPEKSEKARQILLFGADIFMKKNSPLEYAEIKCNLALSYKDKNSDLMQKHYSDAIKSIDNEIDKFLNSGNYIEAANMLVFSANVSNVIDKKEAKVRYVKAVSLFVSFIELAEYNDADKIIDITLPAVLISIKELNDKEGAIMILDKMKHKMSNMLECAIDKNDLILSSGLFLAYTAACKLFDALKNDGQLESVMKSTTKIMDESEIMAFHDHVLRRAEEQNSNWIMRN